jgi:hypothetical protein
MRKKKITVSKAYSKNTNEIAKFIKTNHVFKFNIKNFYNALQSNWYKKKEIGFILRNNKNKIVGFLGVIHSDNNIYPNSKYQICCYKLVKWKRVCGTTLAGNLVITVFP